ncbi:uncharacterized protein VICG_00975 [Vittaforma corneae ATCC 50505]|uniref:Uncharacterized protein n=1 Tax=Vittaforma corneae (strain ATCC 50505) TaxID=993615 RepID=L2GM40_VITCO|nr:uncharacterized protein VICG_00975 [Vittaforma corneae ATCC 50505]ELA41958.1 hypothetical protein VICG_00975 [Vittaforma corneae ATCC 50505]
MYETLIKLSMKRMISSIAMQLLTGYMGVTNCGACIMQSDADSTCFKPSPIDKSSATELDFSTTFTNPTVCTKQLPLGIEFVFCASGRFKTFANNNNVIAVLQECLERTKVLEKAKAQGVDTKEVLEIVALHLYSLVHDVVRDQKADENMIYDLRYLVFAAHWIYETKSLNGIKLAGISLEKSPVSILKFFYDHCNTRGFNFDRTSINVTELNEHDFNDVVRLTLNGNGLTSIPCLYNFTNLMFLDLEDNDIAAFEPERMLGNVTDRKIIMNRLRVINLEGNPNLAVDFPKFRRRNFPQLVNVHVDDVVYNNTNKDVIYDLDKRDVFILPPMIYRHPQGITLHDLVFRNPVSRAIKSLFNTVWTSIFDD